MADTFGQKGQAVLESLLGGASAADAAAKHDLASRTIERWIEKGRDDPDGRYGEFAAAVDDQREAREFPPGPMTAAEFRQAIDGAVRAGSVPAMRLWSELFLDEGDEEPEADPGDVIDLLARRRKAKGAK